MDKTIINSFCEKNRRFFDLSCTEKAEPSPYFNEVVMQHILNTLKSRSLNTYEPFLCNLQFIGKQVCFEHISIMCRKIIQTLSQNNINILYIPTYMSFSDFVVTMIAYYNYLKPRVHYIAKTRKDIYDYLNKAKDTTSDVGIVKLIMIQNRFDVDTVTLNLDDFTDDLKSSVVLCFCCLYCTPNEQTKVLHGLNSSCSAIFGIKIVDGVIKESQNRDLIPLITYYDSHDLSHVLDKLKEYSLQYTVQEIIPLHSKFFLSGFTKDDTSILEEIFLRSFGYTCTESEFVKTLVTTSKNFNPQKYTQFFVLGTDLFLYNIMHFIEFIMSTKLSQKKPINLHTNLIPLHLSWLEFSRESNKLDTSKTILRHHRNNSNL